MKQDLSQIHIWEAFEGEQAECPICVLAHKTKNRLVESVFGETVMDYDFQRSLGPENSFCKEHFLEMYDFNDKLGLALIVDRIMDYEQQQIKKISNSVGNGKNISKVGIRKRLSGILPGQVQNTVKEKKHDKCVICRRIDAATENSIKIMIDIWKKDETFRSLYGKSQGFCLKHFESIMETAASSHKDKKVKQDFIQATMKLQLENSERLHTELKWFIDKFDYRNSDAPWGSSRDSLYRALIKLTGYFDKPEE